MAMYKYSARDANGNLTTGAIEAADADAVAKVLLNRSITPLTIELRSEDEQAQQSGIHWWTPRVSLDDLVIFARQMYSLTKSGIPILRAVNGLAHSSSAKRMRLALEDVADQLERGRGFSSALHQHPEVFSPLFVSVVHVGENTGKLDEAFLQLARYLEREQETRKQIKAATRYPIFVIVAIAIAMVILNLKVIPVFAGMFNKFNAELPAMTQFLLGMSAFFVNYWPYMLATLLFGIWSGRRYLASAQGRYRWDRRKLMLPAVGSIFERTLLGRFARSFSMMITAGIPLTTALNLVADAVDNHYMADRIIGMRRNIEKGESLSRVASASGLFTPLVLQMINVGEETGRVDELLTEVADYYEREVDYDLKSLTARIEPLLIVIVAGMVLVLALGIFTPMWDMMGAYRGTTSG
ncbi:type II secretion system F family protein [Aestuariibacter halophilus]|uniref:Type II secretion system F family protein n=1 Tax=Fluctibacter halophilus TaxID=226011 RepID=A0ABS8GCT0_9ALTE|nr:type II secretion system F family protein [Aestuariibacter halophilus]MCC2617640.1 type II secretion system F family protein [Aestuariibacter halophilus]